MLLPSNALAFALNSATSICSSETSLGLYWPAMPESVSPRRTVCPSAGAAAVCGAAAGAVRATGAAACGAGAALFTGSAATGTGIGSLSNAFSGGTLGSLAQGVSNLFGAVMGQPGALVSGLGSALGGTATSATGALPAMAGGAGAAADIAASTGAAGGGLGKFLSSEAGAGMLQGIGEYYAENERMKALEEEYDKRREFERESQQRITDSYDVDPSVLVGGPPPSAPNMAQRAQQRTSPRRFQDSRSRGKDSSTLR